MPEHLRGPKGEVEQTRKAHGVFATEVRLADGEVVTPCHELFATGVWLRGLPLGAHELVVPLVAQSSGSSLLL